MDQTGRGQLRDGKWSGYLQFFSPSRDYAKNRKGDGRTRSPERTSRRSEETGRQIRRGPATSSQLQTGLYQRLPPGVSAHRNKGRRQPVDIRQRLAKRRS